MPYNLQMTSTDFKGGINVLASEHFENIKGGATMDAAKFDKGVNKPGKLVMRDKSSGKFVPFDAETYSIDSFDTPSVTHVDFDNDGENDTIVGEILVRGSVYTEKLADKDVPNEFKEAAPMVQFIEQS